MVFIELFHLHDSEEFTETWGSDDIGQFTSSHPFGEEV